MAGGSRGNAGGPIDRVLAALEAMGCEPRPSGSGRWSAFCPVHELPTDGHRRSLSVGLGRDGLKVLLRCGAKCETGRVVKALELEWRDLFPPRPRSRERSPIIAVYQYLDALGELLFEVVRFADGGFAQRRPDGQGGWIWGLDGVPRVLCRLPELLAADPAALVWIVEGEKDVDNVCNLGLVATCNPGGALKWGLLADDTALEGRNVVIVADKDQQGRMHAEDVAQRLHGRALSVKVMELPDGANGCAVKDASDWLDAYNGTPADALRAALVAMAEGAPEWLPDRGAGGQTRLYVGGKKRGEGEDFLATVERLADRWGTPEAAQRYECEAMRRLAAILWVLAVLRGKQPFWLSVWDAGPLCGRGRTWAARVFKQFMEDGLIRRVRKNRGRKEARRFVWAAPVAPEKCEKDAAPDHSQRKGQSVRSLSLSAAGVG